MVENIERVGYLVSQIILVKGTSEIIDAKIYKETKKIGIVQYPFVYLCFNYKAFSVGTS